jgi:uncharacterized BrkB/YihY/UPF0761 family membrane protein
MSWPVIRQTANEAAEDGCFGLAAQLSFYFLLALFPALLFFVAVILAINLVYHFAPNRKARGRWRHHRHTGAFGT